MESKLFLLSNLHNEKDLIGAWECILKHVECDRKQVLSIEYTNLKKKDRRSKLTVDCFISIFLQNGHFEPNLPLQFFNEKKRPFPELEPNQPQCCCGLFLMTVPTFQWGPTKKLKIIWWIGKPTPPPKKKKLKTKNRTR